MSDETGAPLPPPVRPLRCTNPDCTLASGGRCARAAQIGDPLVACPDLVREAQGVSEADVEEALHAILDDSAAPPATQATPTEVRTPWAGQAFSMSDAERLLYRSPARFIAVVGPHRAGKTCLLTAFFLELAQGQRWGFPYRFAGSRSLLGLRTLMHRAADWDGDEHHEIVEYTKVAESDDPQLFLHLALRPEDEADDRVVDLLLADLPGEWIEDHAQKLDDRARRRLGWLERADAILVLVDAVQLLGPKRTDLDKQTGRILRRVVDIAREAPRRPPVALVFTKFDGVIHTVEPPPADQAPDPSHWGDLKHARRTWAAVRHARASGLDLQAFAVSAFPWPIADGHPVGVMEPFTWALARADRRDPWPTPAVPVPDGASSFQAMRRWRRP